nr:hypothetical protein [Sediminispirochaeta bajacaliforniensis]
MADVPTHKHNAIFVSLGLKNMQHSVDQIYARPSEKTTFRKAKTAAVEQTEQYLIGRDQTRE